MRRAATHERAEAVGDWRLGIEEEGAPAVVSLLAPCLIDATTGDGVRRVTRARTVGWERVRGGCVAAVGLSTAASHRGIFFFAETTGARDEVCAPPSRLGQVLFVQTARLPINAFGFRT